MAKFNEDRPFGECSPIENGIAYWQAPYLFDINFNHINSKGEVIEYAGGNKAPPLRTKKIVDEKQTAPIDSEADLVTEESTTIDLLAWANGEVKGVGFFSIRKQMVADGYESPETAVIARELILARLGKPEL